MRSMAASLQRSPSTISREIKRNGGYAGYRATHADVLTKHLVNLGGFCWFWRLHIWGY